MNTGKLPKSIEMNDLSTIPEKTLDKSKILKPKSETLYHGRREGTGELVFSDPLREIK